jgi:hypothetical protein
MAWHPTTQQDIAVVIAQQFLSGGNRIPLIVLPNQL